MIINGIRKGIILLMMSKKIELRVGIFISVTMLLMLSSVVYLLYSRGFFEAEYSFTLFSKSGEDLTEGMPIFFSGFKIGRIEKLELDDKGVVIVKIRVARRHVKWIRTNSVFSLNKPLIGSAKLIVTTENLNSPELTSHKMLEIVVIDDINETIKRIQPTLVKVDEAVENIERITANLANPEGNVNKILSHSEKITATLASKDSLLEMALADKESVKSINESIKKTKDIIEKVDKIATKTDEEVYGTDGLLPLTRSILKDLLHKLEKMNTAIDNVIKISSDAADSTKDLKLLRAEIESTVISIGNLVNEIDKKIPFKKEPEIKLP